MCIMSLPLLFEFVVLLLVSSVRTQGIDLVVKEVFHTNNTVIFFERIGEGDDALNCRTTYTECCKLNYLGEWYYPDGSHVLTNGAGDDFYRNRDDSGNVRLNRRNNAEIPKGVFYCIIPDSQGILTRINAVLYSPNDYPEVIRDPQSLINVDPGSSISFTIGSVRSSAFHWYLNGTFISSNPDKYEGIRHSTLTIRDIRPSDAGSYSCVVSNRLLSTHSKAAELTILPPPTITVQPASAAINISVNSDVEFSISAEGLHLSYLWQRTTTTETEGVPLLVNDARHEGVDMNTLTIRSAQVNDSGLYVCAVSNGAGTETSNEIMLTVIKPIPVINITAVINVTAFISSAHVRWILHDNFGDNSYYELQYFLTAFPSHTTSINTTSPSYEITGLIPLKHYRFQVRVCSDAGCHGDWMGTAVTLEQRIPAVKDLSVQVVNSTSIRISWTPLDKLPGWNISYYYISYTAYLPLGEKSELTFKTLVKGGRTYEDLSVDKLLQVKSDVVHVFEVNAALEITNLEGIGEVKGETAVANISLEYDTLPFQVMIGPVEYCINWGREKADYVRSVLTEALVEGISSRCACSFSKDFIGSGFFSCRSSRSHVTYRSTVTGLNATRLISCIQEWVNSSAILIMDWHAVDVYDDCPVSILKLDQPDCQVTSIPVTCNPDV